MRYALPSCPVAYFWHATKSLFRKPDSQLVRFNNSNFKILPSDQQIEEEVHDNTTKGRYYPVQIGDVINEKYQVLGKLGYSLGSTVWLANELSMQGPNGEHHCLVYEPMLESVRELLYRNPSGRFTEDLLRVFLQILLFALDYLHTDAHLIHTGKLWPFAFNILLGIGDKSIIQKFVEAEQRNPSPRKDIWDLSQGKHLFYGRDPKEEKYMTRAHLADMIALMGPPPPELLKVGKRTAESFDKDGGWIAEIPVPARTSLEESEENLEGSNKEAFLKFMRKMVQWRPVH
ncbi:MAG: hypothetical protein L6R40_007079 [Gallowayella cf. fulva]|nr:MAG: hypothetical protein L6R40_007079 [Xanthomendoza cf. fulva]